MNAPDLTDIHNLRRFVSAQDGKYETALAELRRGRKESHWIWFIFPQVAGLGHSPMAQEFAIRSRAEAEDYLKHQALGPRLHKCASALLAHQDRRMQDIMHFPDDLKLRSSMTLFAAISDSGSVFHQVLDAFYSSETDSHTLDFLKNSD